VKVKNIEIPQAAIDGGRKTMTGRFRASDVQGGVAHALRTLADDQRFDYGAEDKDTVDMRVADRLIQSARRLGEIQFQKGGYWLPTTR
jgi:hypothetical protein